MLIKVTYVTLLIQWEAEDHSFNHFQSINESMEASAMVSGAIWCKMDAITSQWWLQICAFESHRHPKTIQDGI